MADISFDNYSIDVKDAIESKVTAFLNEVCGELRSRIQRASRRKTSQTAGSYKYVVNGHTGYVGSNMQNAIWEEFGTGIHAINGDGRKTSWSYQDEHGQWHKTSGKKANRPMLTSYNGFRPSIETRAKEVFGDLSE